MKISKLRHLLLPVACCVIVLASTMDCMAAPRPVPNMPLAPPKGVRVESAWVRAAPPGAMMLAGYMTLRNDGTTPQRFVSAESDAFGMVELHKSVIVNGVSTMRAAGDQVIPAGGALSIAPGGFHLMLMEPKRVFKIGDTVRFRLHFANGTALDVVAPISVEAPAAAMR